MTAPKWKPAMGLYYIPCNSPRDVETVDGFAWGHFGLTYRQSHGLVLFHLPSGYEFPGRVAFKSRGAAMKLAQALAPLTDWSRTRDTLAAEEGLHRKVNDTLRPFIKD